MSGRTAGELDEDESLRGNADNECAVPECEVLRRRRSARFAELGDLIASWEGGTSHCIVCFDDVSMVGV